MLNNPIVKIDGAKFLTTESGDIIPLVNTDEELVLTGTAEDLAEGKTLMGADGVVTGTKKESEGFVFVGTVTYNGTITFSSNKVAAKNASDFIGVTLQVGDILWSSKEIFGSYIGVSGTYDFVKLAYGTFSGNDTSMTNPVFRVYRRNEVTT